MSKRAFDKIAEGLESALVIAKEQAESASYCAQVPECIDVRRVRQEFGVNQPDEASTLVQERP